MLVYAALAMDTAAYLLTQTPRYKNYLHYNTDSAEIGINIDAQLASHISSIISKEYL